MAVIYVRVQPRASRNEAVRREGEVWWIRLAAPPVEGKANAALLEYLSDVLGLAKSHLAIQHGHTGRRKAVLVDGLSQEEAEGRLSVALITRHRRP